MGRATTKVYVILDPAVYQELHSRKRNHGDIKRIVQAALKEYFKKHPRKRRGHA